MTNPGTLSIGPYVRCKFIKGRMGTATSVSRAFAVRQGSQAEAWQSHHDVNRARAISGLRRDGCQAVRVLMASPFSWAVRMAVRAEDRRSADCSPPRDTAIPTVSGGPPVS